MRSLAEAGAALLGQALAGSAPLCGGSLSGIVRIVLADGREAVAKGGPSPRTEAAMLEAIRASGAPAPAVFAVSDDVLVIERLPAGSGPSGAWADLGSCLAVLHGARGAYYGWPADYAFGRVAIFNGRAERWPDFWAERRLLPCVPHIAPDLARRVEALAARLAERLPERPAPALLHGDLWGGNVLAAGGRVSGLIDPACSYGHAEVDLGMLGLFDRVPAAFRDAYGALEPGHAERAPIYRLWPALVHLRLFGAGYRALVDQQLSASGV